MFHRAFFLVVLAACASAAADISGIWSGTLQLKMPDGQVHTERGYFLLKQDGTSVTGRAGKSARESGPIQPGKMDGDTVSFEQALPNGGTAKFKLQLASEAAMTGTVAVEGPFTVAGTVELKRQDASAASEPEAEPAAVVSAITAYDDVRAVKGMPGSKDIRQVDLSGRPELLPTLSFNQKTAWPVASRMPASPRPADLIKAAMDPGLGVRQLHAEGITGEGVSVAIIDQPLYRDHPEFAGKIAAYEDTGCNSQSSMHGPSVASLLVGTNIGTAPDAKLYFAAAPSWLRDTLYQAKALDWVVAQNRKLPLGARIRVVSVSAAPSGKGSPFTKNTEMWDEAVRRAEAEGILVLDCTEHRAVTGPCWLKGTNRDDPAGCAPGYPGIPNWPTQNRVLCPASPRTTAEEYDEGEFGYMYSGRGGQSWTVPYAAGVLALGWQVRPELTAKQALDLLLKSAYQADSGARIINPRGFIRAVKEFQN
jgi:subtilase family protein